MPYAVFNKSETAMFIDANTPREALVEAAYSSFDALGFFADRNVDPETAATEEIRSTLVDFIAAGDECAAA